MLRLEYAAFVTMGVGVGWGNRPSYKPKPERGLLTIMSFIGGNKANDNNC